MQSPITFIMRPFICEPLGIVIGLPVWITSNPLFSPSVLSIATVRTVSSPICCCTSTTSLLPSSLITSKASWIFGNTSSAFFPAVSKTTSITGPIICEIRPLLFAITFSYLSCKAIKINPKPTCYC